MLAQISEENIVWRLFGAGFRSLHYFLIGLFLCASTLHRWHATWNWPAIVTAARDSENVEPQLLKGRLCGSRDLSSNFPPAMLSRLLYPLLLQWAISDVQIPTVEIAAGVHMPVMSIGTQIYY